MNEYNKPKRRYYRYGQAESELIDAIQCGLILGVIYLFSELPKKLKPFFKNRGQKKFKQTIKRLKEKNIISLSGDKIILTKKGKELQKQIQVRNIEIPKPKQWDRIWRIISYDIPNKKENERGWFRRSLERLNFKKIHESLWIYPFECREEVAILAEHFNVTAHVIIMTTDHLPNQDKMEKCFGLHYKNSLN